MTKKINRYGTAALRDVGLGPGNIPLLGADGKLPSSVIDSLPSGSIILFEGSVVPSGWTGITVSGLIPENDIVSPVFTSSGHVSPEEASEGDWSLTCDQNIESPTPIWNMMDGVFDSWTSSTVFTPPVTFTLENTNGDEFSFDSYSIFPKRLMKRVPAGWDIEYWDGSAWQTGDSRTGITWVEGAIQYFDCPQRITSTKIRLVTTEMDATADRTQIGELTLHKGRRWIQKD